MEKEKIYELFPNVELHVKEPDPNSPKEMKRQKQLKEMEEKEDRESVLFVIRTSLITFFVIVCILVYGCQK